LSSPYNVAFNTIFLLGIVTYIAKKRRTKTTVNEEIKLQNVRLIYTRGVDGGRGWKEDVKNMLLDISKLKSLRRKPKLNSKQAIRKAAKHLITKS